MLNDLVYSIANMATEAEDGEDAKRLQRLLDAVKAKKVTQKQFAAEAKIPGGPSMLSQHLSGHRPISTEAAIAYARGFGTTIDEVSPAAARVVREAVELLAERQSTHVKEAEPARNEELRWPLPRVDLEILRQLPPPVAMNVENVLLAVLAALGVMPKLPPRAVSRRGQPFPAITPAAESETQPVQVHKTEVHLHGQDGSKAPPKGTSRKERGP